MEPLLPHHPLTAAGAAERRLMQRQTERGEGRLGGIIFLILVVAAAYAAWNVAPVYFAHYDFMDKVNEIARTPRYRARNDEQVMEMLMKEVRERRLDEWLNRNSFRISTTETSRRIVVYYEREAKVLPGWVKVFKFDYTADQPLI
jgi:hypothetical protein